MAGQSINDRITAARYSIAGQGLAKSVCKATTEEVIGPKKKHLDYLLQCTNEPNVSIPQLANLLIERTQNQAWVIVFKALITVHTLMCYGNERFTQYLASSNCKFNLSGFLDKTGTTDQPQLSYDMSTFIRRYAKYINEKAISYRTVAFDFCKVKRGKNEGAVRTLNTDQLLKTLPVLQQHLDALLDFDCTASELNNGVINAAFMLLFRDLIRLFACYNDGIINLLEKYFDMNKKQCRDALDCYKKFLIRMDRVSEFLKVAEAVGMDKSEIPDLKQAPSSLLEALEGHLASLEGKKPPTSTPPASASNQFESVLTALSSTSASFGLASSNGTSNGAATNGANGGGATATANGTNFNLDELTKQQALAEEEAMYEKLRAEAAKNNPFLSSPGSEAPPAATAAPDTAATIIDLFAAESPAAATGHFDPAVSQASTKASDDLLQLAAGNPFADMMAAPAPPVVAPMHTNGYTPFSSQIQGFVNDNAFAAVFGGAGATNTQNTFDGFGDIMKPESGVGAAVPAPSAPAGAPAKLISGDLDSSLSSLVDNLNIKGPAVKPQWQSPKTPNKTGGVNWTPPQPTQGNFARPQQQWGPMGAPAGGGMAAAGVQPMMAGAPPVQPAPSAQQPAAFDPFGAL